MNRTLPPIKLFIKERPISRTASIRLALVNRYCHYPFLLLLTLCFFSLRSIAQLTAGFTADDTAFCAPFAVHFTNTSTGATSYAWDLGNGNTSALKDVTGTYLTAGTYTVTLTASSATSSKTYSLVVRAYNPPTVDFTSSSATVCPGVSISFASTSVANCWGGLTYKWNFGDGGSSVLSTPSYSYVTPGAYNVTLLAINSVGCINSVAKPSYVHIFSTANIGFSASNIFFCKVPASASFSNTATTGTPPLTYTWSFGDGSSIVGANPSHTYTASGRSNDVTLRVKDGNGCTDSLVKRAYINTGNLTAAITSASAICQYTPLSFTNASSTHSSSKWYFGDGETSTAESPAHSYKIKGTYTVKLVVKDSTCADSTTKTITVYKPTGTYVISPADPCPPPTLLTFTASTAPGNTVKWRSDIIGALGSGSPLNYTFYSVIPDPRAGVIHAISMIVTDGVGCTDTISQGKDTVNGGFAELHGSPSTVGCTPLLVNFALPVLTAIVHNPLVGRPPFYVQQYPYVSPPVSYNWDFGDGSPTSSLPTPSHTYTAEGAYVAICSVYTANGCVATGFDSILAGSIAPVATFTRSPGHVCAGQTISYLGATSDPVTSWVWDFEDGGTSIAQNPLYTYKKGGIYETVMRASYKGCTGPPYRIKDTVDAPGSDLRYKFSCIPANEIMFADSSVGADSRVWDFGDGTTSTLPNPVHRFPALITYSVTLTTHNNASGCTNISSVDLYLQRVSVVLSAARPGICRDASDTMFAKITNFCVGPKAKTFALNGVWDVNGGVKKISRLYTDDDYLGACNKIDTAFSVFPLRGANSVRLIITDNHSCLDTGTVNVNVAKPIANFSFTPASGCGPLAVAFKDISTDIPGAVLSKYVWSFGDGVTDSVTSSPYSHTYFPVGTYTVKEVAINNLGCADTFTSSLTPVVSRPSVSFLAGTIYSCVGLSVSFNNTTTGATTFLWKFGDGTTSAVPSPSHIYSVPGLYTVTLIAISGTACRDTLVKNDLITVNPVPRAAFTMNDSFSVCPPLSVDFTNTSTGAATYQWAFGDGNSSVNTDPSNIYTVRGPYKIKLLALNAAGCSDTAVHYASIFGYAGAFTYTPIKVCSSSPVKFKATISGVANMEWDFSDGFSSGPTLADTISHRYTATGSYVPKLLLIDGAGCTSVSVGADTIKVDTIAPAFTFLPATSCQNIPVTFTDSTYSYSSVSTGWLWQFGTGATSTLKTPVYTYTASGTYTVRLTVTNGTGCTGSVTKNIKVDATPGGILGVTYICTGNQTTLSNTTTGGKWSSSNTGIATVDSVNGVVTGISAATATITYKLLSGCDVSVVVTVNPLPTPIISPSQNICEGFTITFSNATAGGGWSSANTTVADVSFLGVVRGVLAGTTTISYTLSSGCSATKPVTVATSPAPITPTGPRNVCIGSSIALSNAIAGGIWSSGIPSIATVGSATGVVTGVSSAPSANIAPIIYTLPSGCTAQKTVSVSPAMPVITGPLRVCIGDVITLSNSSAGGTWQSANTSIATAAFGTGKITGVSLGNAEIRYTGVTGCIVTTTVTVDTLPAAITGLRNVCVGETVALSDEAPGGLWSTSATIAAVGTGTGIVSGIRSGSATITYTISTSCRTTIPVTVDPLPGTIFAAGSGRICAGASVTMGAITPGGSWSSSASVVLVVGSTSGVVTGLSEGTATITYRLRTTGCYITTVLTVTPIQAKITGDQFVCAGFTTVLSDTGSGVWSSGATLIARIGTGTGIITGVSAGTATITYTKASGCKATLVVTVDPVPPPIAGVAKLCVGETAVYSNTMPGGKWSISNTAIAVIDTNTGTMTSAIAGTATISYSMPTGCRAILTITVNPLPAAITGGKDVCINSEIFLSSATMGGSWASGNASVATVGLLSGIILGKTTGTTVVTYTLSTGCLITDVIKVHPLPLPITGTGHICMGDTAMLSDATIGGAWLSSNTGIAVVRADTGIVTGVSDGTVTITYMLGTGCIATTSFSVHAVPSVIMGAGYICKGTTVELSNTVAEGTWSSSNIGVVSVNYNTGAATGLNLGTAAITYTTTGNCSATITLTVYPVLSPLVGDTVLCKGDTSLLYEDVAGGVWSSSNTTVASVDGNGVVRSVRTGSTDIIYSLARSCGTAKATVRVDPLPAAGVVKGPERICTGAEVQFTDSIKGGVWTVSNSTLASIDTSGNLTGIKQGYNDVLYIFTNSCGSDTAKRPVYVVQGANNAHIVIFPDAQQCANTLFQNFGADSPEPPGGNYVWSAENATIYAVSANRQNCLVNFDKPGTCVIKLSAGLASSECATAVAKTFEISNEVSPKPVVIYYSTEFVCKDYTADSYRWGYDDRKTLDSTLLVGEVNENYTNPAPDLYTKYYWVITDHKGCLQKSYYNAPTGINIGHADAIDILLYPNPAETRITMEVKGIDKADEISYKLVDILGKEKAIGELTAGKGTLMLDDSPPGIYMVLFTRNGVKIGSKVFVKK